MSQRAELIQVGGAPFVAGLAWHTFTDRKDLSRNVAKIGLSDFHAKHAVRLADGQYASAGFVDEDTVKEFGGPKAAKKYPSLAAVLLKALAANDAIAAVPTDTAGRFALVEISSGVVDTDMVGDELEVKDRFLQRASRYGADNTYAPKEWGIATAQPTDNLFIERLASNSARKAYGIVPTKQQGPLIAIAALMMLGVVGVVGFQVYQSAKEERLAAERKAAQERVAAQLAEKAKQDAQQAKVGPWADLPLAQELVGTCAAYLADAAYESVPGWTLGEISCDVANVRIVFNRRDGGTNGRILAAYPTVAVALDGKQAILNASFNTQMAMATEQPQTSLEVIKTFVSAWQRVGLPLTLAEVPPPPPPNPKEPPPPPPYKTYKWQLATKVRPTQLASALNFPTVRVTKISMRHTTAGPEYQLEGHVYGT